MWHWFSQGQILYYTILKYVTRTMLGMNKSMQQGFSSNSMRMTFISINKDSPFMLHMDIKAVIKLQSSVPT